MRDAPWDDVPPREAVTEGEEGVEARTAFSAPGEPEGQFFLLFLFF